MADCTSRITLILGFKYFSLSQRVINNNIFSDQELNKMNISELLLLKWNDHSTSIAQIFLQSLMNEQFVDVTLSCQGQFIRVHKLILSAASPYFEMLFRIHQQKDIVIIVNSMSIYHLRLVIEYIYTGEIKVMDHELVDFLQAAEQLQIKSLSDVLQKKNCKQENFETKNFSSNINCDNNDHLISKNEDEASKIENEIEGKLYKEKDLQSAIQKTTLPKIRRPPNAFMVFANQWRRKIATAHAADSNKEISVRLGQIWNNLEAEEKAQYFEESRRVDKEHRLKYPGYCYNPLEARKKRRQNNPETDIKRKPCEIPAEISIPDKTNATLMEHYDSSESTDDAKLDSSAEYKPEMADVINAVIGMGIKNCIIENNNIVTKAEIETNDLSKSDVF